MGEKIEARETDENPVCPHCEKRIQEVLWRRVQAMKPEYLYMCPMCKKIIGFIGKN